MRFAKVVLWLQGIAVRTFLHVAGGEPTMRLNARLNAASDS